MNLCHVPTPSQSKSLQYALEILRLSYRGTISLENMKHELEVEGLNPNIKLDFERDRIELD
jgi:hypothetical protein